MLKRLRGKDVHWFLWPIPVSCVIKRAPIKVCVSSLSVYTGISKLLLKECCWLFAFWTLWPIRSFPIFCRGLWLNTNAGSDKQISWGMAGVITLHAAAAANHPPLTTICLVYATASSSHLVLHACLFSYLVFPFWHSDQGDRYCHIFIFSL